VPINAFVDAVLVAAAARLALPTGANEAALAGTAGFLLFGIAHPLVAPECLDRPPADGLGWYWDGFSTAAVAVATVAVIGVFLMLARRPRAAA
jgi:hypothetical protein